MKKERKKYNVTVSHPKKSPEETARLQAQIADAIYRSKMSVMNMPVSSAETGTA